MAVIILLFGYAFTSENEGRISFLVNAFQIVTKFTIGAIS